MREQPAKELGLGLRWVAAGSRALVHTARDVEATLDLDATTYVHGEPSEVRDIFVHLVEEYARHVGHADLLRECIDGRTGQ